MDLQLLGNTGKLSKCQGGQQSKEKEREGRPNSDGGKRIPVVIPTLAPSQNAGNPCSLPASLPGLALSLAFPQHPTPPCIHTVFQTSVF